jgi:hypothetical protein
MANLQETPAKAIEKAYSTFGIDPRHFPIDIVREAAESGIRLDAAAREPLSTTIDQTVLRFNDPLLLARLAAKSPPKVEHLVQDRVGPLSPCLAHVLAHEAPVYKALKNIPLAQLSRNDFHRVSEVAFRGPMAALELVTIQ